MCLNLDGATPGSRAIDLSGRCQVDRSGSLPSGLGFGRW